MLEDLTVFIGLLCLFLLLYLLFQLLYFFKDIELNPGPIRGHSAKLAFAISTDLQRVTNALYAAGLIPEQTRDKMFVSGSTDHDKASELVSVIGKQLKASLDPDQYLFRTCEVLRDQQSPTLTDIANGELCGLY